MSDDDDCNTPLVVVAPANPHLTKHSAAARHSSSGGGAASNGRSTKQRSYTPSAFAAATASAPEGAAKAHAATASKWSRSWQSLLAPFACLCWIACSSGAILVNKHILVDLNFPFPCTVAALGITGTSIISILAVKLLKLEAGKGKAAVSWWFYCTYIVPAGLCVALAMQLGNAAYLYLSVAYVQMLKAFTPVVTMLFALLFGLERPSLLLISAVGLITAGVAVASWGEGSLSVTGITAMVASLICEALRLVLMQSLVSKREMHPVQTLAYIAPAATVWMLLIASLTEALQIHQAQALHDILKHPLTLVASAAAGFGANAMAMLVISLSGALTLKCLGLAKDVGLVVVGVVVLGEVVSTVQGMGYSISLLGFLLYNAARMWTGKQLGAQDSSRGSGDSKVQGSGKQGADKARRSSGDAKGSGLLRAQYLPGNGSKSANRSTPLLRTPPGPKATLSTPAAGAGTGAALRLAIPAGPVSAATAAVAASIHGAQRGPADAGEALRHVSRGWVSGVAAYQGMRKGEHVSPTPLVSAAALPTTPSS